MRATVVRARRGRRRHAVSEGADSPRVTLCRKNADGMALDDRGVDCPRCLAELEQLGWQVIST